MHPVQLIYDHLTSIVAPAMPETVSVDVSCSYCGRDPGDFGHAGYVGKDGYKQPITCCPACESFAIGDIEITGIESIRGKGNKVPQKFGMWPGVSAAIEVETGRAVLLPPKGVYEKLPASFLQTIETLELPKAKRIAWIVGSMTFPLVYISDFGKTTSSLIANLRVSSGPEELLAVSDKGIERINASASLAVHSSLDGLSRKELDLFDTTVRSLALGTTTPRQANAVWSEHPNLAKAARLLPVDPHQRLSLLALVRNMRT